MIRTGIDIIELDRLNQLILKYQDRFLQRIFTKDELEQIGDNVSSLGVRFAAKEAVVKALGTGIGKVGWLDIEILRGGTGEPMLHLYGSAQRIADQQGLIDWSVSLSHTQNIAVAVVVAVD
jgi:holo-[acyl-carrier protein] synthase